MTRVLRKSTRKKTELSKTRAERSIHVARAIQKSFRAKAKIAEKALPRHKQHRETGGLVPMKPPKHLKQRTIANANSPLFRLPAEIRNIIFELALTSNRTTIDIAQVKLACCNPYPPMMHYQDKMLVASALPLVCRQAYQETATTIYSRNMFCFSWAPICELWLSLRLPAQLRAIRHLKFQRYFDLAMWHRSQPIDIDEEVAEMVNMVKASCPLLELVDEEHRGYTYEFVYRHP